MCSWPNCNQSRKQIARITSGRGEETQPPAVARPVDEPGDAMRSPGFTFRRIPPPNRDRQADIRPFFRRATVSLSDSTLADSKVLDCSARVSATRVEMVSNIAGASDVNAAGSAAVSITPERGATVDIASDSNVVCGAHRLQVPDTGRAKQTHKRVSSSDSASLESMINGKKLVGPKICETEDKKPRAITSKPIDVNLFLKHVSCAQTTYVPIAIDSVEWDNLPAGVGIHLANDLTGPDPNRIIVELDDDAEEVPDFMLNAIPIETEPPSAATLPGKFMGTQSQTYTRANSSESVTR